MRRARQLWQGVGEWLFGARTPLSAGADSKGGDASTGEQAANRAATVRERTKSEQNPINQFTN